MFNVEDRSKDARSAQALVRVEVEVEIAGLETVKLQEADWSSTDLSRRPRYRKWS